MKFSIIIPAFNTRKYIKKCINSVIGQADDVCDVEIIVVDDGSTDGLYEDVAYMAKEDGRIILIRQENRGSSVARNAGIKNAHGDYIVFLDSDDMLAEYALTELRKKTHCNPDIIICRTSTYKEASGEIRTNDYHFEWENGISMDSGQVLKDCGKFSSFWFAPWMLVINREYLVKNKLYFVKDLSSEDELWTPVAILQSKKVAYCKYPYYINRADRLGSLTQTKNIKKEFDKLYITSELMREGVKRGFDKDRMSLLKARIAELYLGIIIGTEKWKDDVRYNELIEELKASSTRLKAGRYWMVYIATKVFGIKMSASILNRIYIVKNVIRNNQ